jgi:hypothetical protein
MKKSKIFLFLMISGLKGFSQTAPSYVPLYDNVGIDLNNPSFVNGMGKLYGGTNAPITYGPFLSFGGGGYSTQFNSEHFANGKIFVRVNGDVGNGNWSYLYNSGMIDQLKTDLSLPTSGGYDLQSVTSRGNILNNPIVLNNNGYFLGDANYGVRFNDSQSLFNNFVIKENGDTYTRGNIGIGQYTPREKLDVNGNIIWSGFKGGNVRALNTGYSGVNYGGIGYNVDFTTSSGIFNRPLPDASSYMEFTNGGFRFYGNSGHVNTDGVTLDGGGNNLNLFAVIASNGDVGIGTATPREKLSVNGKIRAHEVKVETANWPDYVFEDNYKRKTLAEIEKFIKTNKHLPEVPSAKEVEKNGLELGEMNKILLKKIEELTLHLIEKDNRLRKIETKQNKIEAMLKELTKTN